MDDRDNSRLSAAILRINRSLDLTTVLNEVVESARALTGACSGVSTTLDERGEIQDFVTSGLSPGERVAMVEWPDGQRLFKHLRDLPAPLRVADFPGYLCSLGLSPASWRAMTLQGTPILHRGEHLGHFFLGNKEDEEAFTAGDEEVLVLFASQAATAIANARTHRDVERARADLEALERQRAEFLGMESHELRVPLTSIKGSTASVLGAAPVPPRGEMLQFFRIIDKQADHMRGLIANLLDAGSIEAGTLTVAPAPSDVAKLVDQARNTFLSGGGRNPVPIDLPPDLPWVMADSERIVQVLNNLLANAARHSSPTSPIRVEGAREGGYVALSVSDEGQGIPPDRLRRLFHKRSGLSGGTGLGLVICKGLVEAHGGRIGAESGGPGPGTRVTFTIPVAESTPGDAAPPGRPPHADRKERARILVLDDDPETLRHVRSALSDARYAPIVTGDPDGLSELIRAERPHLVLLDLMLPGTNGIELMKQVPELSDLPVIFISGYGRDETIARALGSGGADYIVKPFSSTELVARVKVALRGRAAPDTFAFRELTVVYSRRQVTLAGHRLRLTPTQFELLRVLTRDAGHVVTTRTLLLRVWGKRASRHNDRIRTVVKQLRAKLGDDADDPAYIFTEHGVGYRFGSPAGA